MHERFKHLFGPRPARSGRSRKDVLEEEISAREAAKALAREAAQVAGCKLFVDAFRAAVRYEIGRSKTPPEAGIEARAAGGFRADGLETALQVFDAMIEGHPDG